MSLSKYLYSSVLRKFFLNHPEYSGHLDYWKYSVGVHLFLMMVITCILNILYSKYIIIYFLRNIKGRVSRLCPDENDPLCHCRYFNEQGNHTQYKWIDQISLIIYLMWNRWSGHLTNQSPKNGPTSQFGKLEVLSERNPSSGLLRLASWEDQWSQNWQRRTD